MNSQNRIKTPSPNRERVCPNAPKKISQFVDIRLPKSLKRNLFSESSITFLR